MHYSLEREYWYQGVFLTSTLNFWWRLREIFIYKKANDANRHVLFHTDILQQLLR